MEFRPRDFSRDHSSTGAPLELRVVHRLPNSDTSECLERQKCTVNLAAGQLHLDVWDTRRHKILFEEKHWLCKKYLVSTWREDTKEKWAQTHTSLYLWG